MDTETIVELLWSELYLDTGKTSCVDRFNYVVGNTNEWTYKGAFVSILDKRGHYCVCSKVTNSYYLFERDGLVIHVGDCCLGKMKVDSCICSSDMAAKKLERDELVKICRKLYNEQTLPVYTKRPIK